MRWHGGFKYSRRLPGFERYCASDVDGYTTEAERYGWSYVFQGLLDKDDREHVVDNAGETLWWLSVEGATWLRPSGSSSSVMDADLPTRPVTHISWNDARAYAEWAGKRLPTEAEWCGDWFSTTYHATDDYSHHNPTAPTTAMRR